VTLKNLIEDALCLTFPNNLTCDICGTEVFDGNTLCEECKQSIEFNNGHTCPICGRKTTESGICLECKALAPKYKRATSALVYREGTVKLIYKYKSGCGYLKDYFAELIAPKCDVFADADGISFVPMTKRAEYDRGYNQSELIAKELSKKLGLPLLKGAIKKTKESAEQKTLTRREREKNLAKCFKADKKVVAGKKIIVVDDVMTTGATADEVTGALLKAGAAAVYFTTIASVEYKRQL
jgi:ComF family protein